MRFPSADRVVYERTSLVEVICQLKFPPILRIDTEAVSAFQERVRAELPGYDRRELGQVDAPVVIADGKPILLPQFSDRRVEHAFLSPDGSSKVTLGRDFVAHATQAYGRWEPFMETVRLAATTMLETYAPAPITRVGLRYQNVVRRSRLELGDEPWRNLLRPALLGLLSDESIDVDHGLREDAFALEVGGLAGRGRVFHGLVTQEGEQCYLLDTDFFVEEVVAWSSVEGVLDELHRQSWDCFQYFVEPPLHEAMRPRSPT